MMILTETPPPAWMPTNLLMMDAEVVEVAASAVVLRTAIDARIVLPRETFERRDCLPPPGTVVSLDIEQWHGLGYVSRLMVGARFAHLADAPAAE